MGKNLLLFPLVILCNGYVMVIFSNLQNKHFRLFGKLVILVIVGIWFWFLTEIRAERVKNWIHAKKGWYYKTKKETKYVIPEHIKKEWDLLLFLFSICYCFIVLLYNKCLEQQYMERNIIITSKTAPS